MSATARLSLPYIAPLQAQKQYSYNEAMAVLDQLVQPTVISRTTGVPPVAPDEGDTYIVAPSATGAWAGKDGQFACWRDEAWSYRMPADGWLAFVTDTAEVAVLRSGSWESFATTGGTSLAKLGINTAADLTSRLSVAADATLLSHDGADHRLTINKAAIGDTASLLFQDGSSGRSEIGLTSDDALHVKVSPDGSSWLEALTIEQSGGLVTLPQGQLAFPSLQNASADPNTLDDYEEGNWVPALNFGGAVTGITYATQMGRYTKVGRKLSVTGSLVLTSKGSATGAATIAGLPFMSANDGIPVAATIGFASGLSMISGAVIATIAANSDRLTLYHSASGSAAALSNANFSNSAQIVFSAVYDV